MDFTDKRVLVTGSSRGIGFDIARAFIAAGARVAVNGKTEQSVSTAIEKLDNHECLVAAPGDIGTVPGCESVVKTAIDAFGGLDILVNSAGIGAGRPIEDSDEALLARRIARPEQFRDVRSMAKHAVDTAKNFLLWIAMSECWNLPIDGLQCHLYQHDRVETKAALLVQLAHIVIHTG